MQTYVVSVNWTEKGIANVRNTEKRVAHGFAEEIDASIVANRNQGDRQRFDGKRL
jgi:uncharacterized protein with GYD domain